MLPVHLCASSKKHPSDLPPARRLAHTRVAGRVRQARAKQASPCLVSNASDHPEGPSSAPGGRSTWRQGVLPLLAVSFLWGSYTPTVRYIYALDPSISPALLTALRTSLSAGVLLAASLTSLIRAGLLKGWPHIEGGAIQQPPSVDSTTTNTINSSDSRYDTNTRLRQPHGVDHALTDTNSSTQDPHSSSDSSRSSNSSSPSLDQGHSNSQHLGQHTAHVETSATQPLSTPPGGGAAATWAAVAVSGLELGAYNFLGTAMQALGLELTTSVKAAFLTQTTAMLTPCFAWLSGQKVKPAHWAACAVALLGSCLVTVDGLMGSPALEELVQLLGTAAHSSSAASSTLAAAPGTSSSSSSSSALRDAQVQPISSSNSNYGTNNSSTTPTTTTSSSSSSNNRSTTSSSGHRQPMSAAEAAAPSCWAAPVASASAATSTLSAPPISNRLPPAVAYDTMEATTPVRSSYGWSSGTDSSGDAGMSLADKELAASVATTPGTTAATSTQVTAPVVPATAAAALSPGTAPPMAPVAAAAALSPVTAPPVASSTAAAPTATAVTGELYVLGACCCYALATVRLSMLAPKHEPLQLATAKTLVLAVASTGWWLAAGLQPLLVSLAADLQQQDVWVNRFLPPPQQELAGRPLQQQGGCLNQVGDSYGQAVTAAASAPPLQDAGSSRATGTTPMESASDHTAGSSSSSDSGTSGGSSSSSWWAAAAGAVAGAAWQQLAHPLASGQLPASLASGVGLAVLLYSAWGPGSLATVLQAKGQAAVSASQAQIVYSLTPVWAALLAALLLPGEEATGPLAWCGGAVIIAATLVLAFQEDQTQEHSSSRSP